MLGLSLRDKVPNTTGRRRREMANNIERNDNFSWNRAVHLANANTGIRKVTEWRPHDDEFRNRKTANSMVR